ncbi:kinase-like domain-containing protein [Cyathus striatus]|nr:kinase-like domain-containing protein [Cyathus striatus]
MAHPNVSLDLSKSHIPILDDDISGMEDTYFGSGGFGEVFQANWRSHAGESIKVAIKVFRGLQTLENTTADVKERYTRVGDICRINRELRVWAALDHPNILKLIGIYTQGKAAPGALVTMYRPDRDAATYVTENPDCDRMCIITGVANALHYLHSENVVHGDVKTKNVIIHKEDGDQIVPELADFGRSRVLERSGDTTGMISSCRYTAPEILTQDDTRSFSKAGDIYSFGMFMLEILTGKIPFYCISNNAKVIIDISTKARKPSRDKYPCNYITDHLWEIMELCWKRNPGDRGTMEEIVMLLNDNCE